MLIDSLHCFTAQNEDSQHTVSSIRMTCLSLSEKVTMSERDQYRLGQDIWLVIVGVEDYMIGAGNMILHKGSDEFLIVTLISRLLK